jgi:hypothetical protein
MKAASFLVGNHTVIRKHKSKVSLRCTHWNLLTESLDDSRSWDNVNLIIEDSSEVSKCQFGSSILSSSSSMMAFSTQTDEKDKSGHPVRPATIQLCTWYLNALASKNSFIADRGVVQTAANAGISGNAAANLKKQGIMSATPIGYIGRFLEHTLMHEVPSLSDIGNCSSSHNE